MGIMLTVYYEEPFWVGIFERFQDGSLEAAKVVFGAEPKDFEVYGLILKGFNNLSFGRSVCVEIGDERRLNPKRLQRKIRREVSGGGVGAKAQQAVKADYEAAKKEKKALFREARDMENQRRFEFRQGKRRAKRRGH